MIGIEDIRQAAEEIRHRVRLTPVLPSPDLSEETGCDVVLKCENLQVTGSYKPRAAFTVLERLADAGRKAGVALSSSGNFASALAYAGRVLNVPTALVMMQKTAPFKVEKTKRYGGEVVFCENQYEARFEALQRLGVERRMTVINHLDNADVIAGHGTIGVEVVEQVPDVAAVLVPASTGGLLAGVATAVKATLPHARIVGVQPEGSNAVALSFTRGEVVRISEVDTICDALTATCPGPLPWEHIRRYVDDVVTVSDDEVKRAVAFLAERAKLVVEAGGAVAVAALRAATIRFPGKKVVAILSGGNIDPSTLARWLSEAAGLG